METETPVSFVNPSMDLPMDGSFPTFDNQDSFIDQRMLPDFNHTLAGKPSPGSNGQFFMDPSLTWERPSYDDTAMSMFTDIPDSPREEASQPQPEQHVSEPSVTIKEEQATENTTINVATVKTKDPPKRRSSRATSNSSARRNSTASNSEKSPTALTSSGTKVKKPRAGTRKAQPRRKSVTKEKALAEVEELQIQELAEEPSPSGDEGQPGGDNRRNKFLERNRVAASKCRQKKKEWMHNLEDTKAELEKKHNALHESFNDLVAEISVMKNYLMMHAGCGDQNIDRYFEAEARKFVARKTGEPTPGQALPPQERHDSISSASASSAAQHSRHSSVANMSPESTATSVLALPAETELSPKIKEEDAFSFDYMPDDLFNDPDL